MLEERDLVLRFVGQNELTRRFIARAMVPKLAARRHMLTLVCYGSGEGEEVTLPLGITFEAPQTRGSRPGSMPRTFRQVRDFGSKYTSDPSGVLL